MRKFIFNGAVISGIFSGISALRATKSGPRDWRLALLWVSWAASIAIAIGNVRDNAEHADD
ncbi:hypothetical protein AX769_15740 [Frondihabitans sp. PAMC 28766]|uniref:hypothetical protein n=1 Tax=Frondihabitans sp. PAMC 28766 TaxID=1795630 RepID=UPI00078E3C62|nr:hypothetical protein [Frondihabitans sp. PAMC 28766]AMM21314.1 hypothetical protein AX769_15740 [Frondihabitans sp. PAMC 28766]